MMNLFLSSCKNQNQPPTVIVVPSNQANQPAPKNGENSSNYTQEVRTEHTSYQEDVNVRVSAESAVTELGKVSACTAAHDLYDLLIRETKTLSIESKGDDIYAKYKNKIYYISYGHYQFDIEGSDSNTQETYNAYVTIDGKKYYFNL